MPTPYELRVISGDLELVDLADEPHFVEVRVTGAVDDDGTPVDICVRVHRSRFQSVAEHACGALRAIMVRHLEAWPSEEPTALEIRAIARKGHFWDVVDVFRVVDYGREVAGRMAADMAKLLDRLVPYQPKAEAGASPAPATGEPEPDPPAAHWPFPPAQGKGERPAPAAEPLVPGDVASSEDGTDVGGWNTALPRLVRALLRPRG